jgi:PAS domain-containing protein
LDAIAGESLDACHHLLRHLAGSHLLSDQLRIDIDPKALSRQHLLEQMPIGCLATDRDSTIQYANESAAALFNISAKHLPGRLLLHFAADRVAFGRLLQDLPLAGGRLEAYMPVRPRDRALVMLGALIVPETPLGAVVVALVPNSCGRRHGRHVARGSVRPRGIYRPALGVRPHQ